MISERLKTLSSLVPPARSLADVGCDHGYLLIEVFQKYGLDYAIAIDNKEKPLKRAHDNLSKYPFIPNIRFSLSDGLQDLKEEVEAVVIAGMGGMLIIDILRNGLNRHLQAKYILQANRNHYELRKFLYEYSMEIVSEKIIFEDGQYYEIIVAKRTTERLNYREEDFIFGPILRKERPKVFIQKLKADLKKLEGINHPSINQKIIKIKEILDEGK
jgi:tRNA (adenine22-N1)-methyltransferase